MTDGLPPNGVELRVDPHPSLHIAAFSSSFPEALGEIASPGWLRALLGPDSRAPLSRDEEMRVVIRDLLRHGGYKPTGRGKPASEYLARAAAEGKLTSINPAVDVCNVVSLHGGLPISVIDLDRAEAPFRVGIAEPGTSYVFNASGQEIALGGLVCLYDAEGPCANAVKDCQRTKTGHETRRTLTIIWGADPLRSRVRASERWYRDLLGRLGARSQLVSITA